MAIVYNDIRMGCVASSKHIVMRGTNVLSMLYSGVPQWNIALQYPHLLDPSLAYGGVWWSSSKLQYSLQTLALVGVLSSMLLL